MIDGIKLSRKEMEKHHSRAVFCTFHQRMFYQYNYLGSLGVTIMISRSKEGQWATRVARVRGFKEVRGSTHKGAVDKGGAAAMKELIEKVKEGQSAGMLVDGPTGPARKVKIGAIQIARETGAPLVSVIWGCDRAWVVNSWDRYMIPKPFAKVYIINGEPRYIPRHASKEELELYRLELENEMNQAAKKCDNFFGVNIPTHGKKIRQQDNK